MRVPIQFEDQSHVSRALVWKLLWRVSESESNIAWEKVQVCVRRLVTAKVDTGQIVACLMFCRNSEFDGVVKIDLDSKSIVDRICYPSGCFGGSLLYQLASMMLIFFFR